MVSDKTNIIYVKVMGEISLNDIDLNRSFVYGGLFEEEDEEKLEAQEYVSGKWCVVYDEFEDASYIIFTPEIINEEMTSYIVTFCDYDGTVIKEQTVTEGSNAEPPEEDPIREHFTFIEWDTNYENINEDLTITAIYKEDIKYTVIFSRNSLLDIKFYVRSYYINKCYYKLYETNRKNFPFLYYSYYIDFILYL